MGTRTLLAACALCAAAPTAAFAEDLVVPRQHDTIDAAQPGDRIVVQGGTHWDLQVHRDDVTIVGRRATLAGQVDVYGSNVTLRGFALERMSYVTLQGDDVAFVGNRPKNARARYYVAAVGDRALVADNRLTAGGWIHAADGADATIRGNRLRRDFEIGSTNALRLVVEGNRANSLLLEGADVVARGNKTLFVETHGDGALVEDNATTRGVGANGDGATIRGNRSRWGVVVNGDDAVVSGNSIQGGMFGVVIHGNGAQISDNDLEVGALNPADDQGGWANCPGIVVESRQPGTVIVDNHVTHMSGTGLTFTGSGAVISDNVLHGIGSMTSIGVHGGGNAVSGNEIVHTGRETPNGIGIEVSGDANAILDNRVVGTAADGILVVQGTGNTLAGDVLERTHGCGILIDGAASDTSVADCTVTGCSLGLVNSSADTTVEGSTLQGNRWADLLDLGAATLLDGNVVGKTSRDSLLLPTH
jgi:hypothetical protein